MTIASVLWRGIPVPASPSSSVFYRPEDRPWVRVLLSFALGLMLLGSVLGPAAAQCPEPRNRTGFQQAVQGQQATTVEGTVLNIVNWGCNVIAPVIAIACPRHRGLAL